MSERSRITLMRSLWFISALTLGAILIGAIGLGGATTWLIALSVAVLSLATLGTVTILRLDDDYALEKAKRTAVDTMLQDMTNEDLQALRQRLSDEQSLRQTNRDHLEDGEEITEFDRG